MPLSFRGGKDPVREKKGTDAIAVHIFQSGLVNGACLTMFINGWNFLVQIYYIPTFYQLVYGYSAQKSAALLLPITLTQSEVYRIAKCRTR